MFENILYISLTIIGIGFLIFIHELGHYLVAKMVKMEVEVFSIGFGKSIFSWRFKDTKWQLSIIPLGGYVKIKGMDSQKDDVKNSYYGKRPIERLAVAFAGPFFNILFTIIAFSLIWGFGGRTKDFSNYTKKIGMVDESSKLYENDVRPGDEITYYDNKPYNEFLDVIKASALKQNKCAIQGYKINYYEDLNKTPFKYEIPIQKKETPLGALSTIGVEGPANYLIFPKVNKNTPLENKVESNDRLLWVNGEIVFSSQQLKNILNSSKVFLTIKRQDSYFHVIVPKVRKDDLLISKKDLGEISDWSYEASEKIEYVLPYFFNKEGFLEKRFKFLEEEQFQELLKKDNRSPFYKNFQKDDQIVAVNGIKTENAIDILKVLQKNYVVIIVQKNISKTPYFYKDADSEFDKVFKTEDLNNVIKNIGTFNQIDRDKDLYLITAIEPITAEKLAQNLGEDSIYFQGLIQAENQIKKIQDHEKKDVNLKELDAIKKQLVLGGPFKDKQVKYNPNPFVLIYDTVVDMGRMLANLLTGNVSPKHIAGPVGIVHIVHKSFSIGFLEVLFWFGFISLNFAFLNLLPIPVLDGGYIIISIIEMVTKKRIKSKNLEKFIIPFFILLILAMVFVLFNDISRIIKMFFS